MPCFPLARVSSSLPVVLQIFENLFSDRLTVELQAGLSELLKVLSLSAHLEVGLWCGPLHQRLENTVETLLIGIFIA